MPLKVAYISDLHLEFYEQGYGPIPTDRFLVHGTVDFPLTLDADVLVIAGDIHHLAWVRNAIKKDLERHYQIPVIIVRGNHDYWNGPFDDTGIDTIKVNGYLIASCTFWTDLSKDPLAHLKARSWIDFHETRGLGVEAWQDRHIKDAAALKILRPDIIVTHHVPTFQSTEPKYAGNPYNIFFMSNHDDLIMDLQPKLWIHGHVHSTWDYHIGSTRIVCNPYGYPNELKRRVDPIIVEVA